jgi:hypothetical protein
VIELVDERDGTTREEHYGSMANASHVSVHRALTKHADRLRNNRGKLAKADDLLTSWAINKTGTVDASLFHSTKENEKQRSATEQQERRRVREAVVSDDVLRIHGMALGSKGGGITRLIYENVNGLSNRITDNVKLERAKDLHDELEVDIAAYNEHRLNMAHRQNINEFNQLFKGGKAAVQSAVAHNVHENIGKVQEGRTSLLIFGAITDYISNNESTKDKSGLGQWLVMTIVGEGAKTRIVCGYNLCFNNNPDSSTTYQQHR